METILFTDVMVQILWLETFRVNNVDSRNDWAQLFKANDVVS